MRLSQLVVDCPALRELDINPLLANESGVIALDARIRIEASELDVPAPNPRLAIRPYPNRWETTAETQSGMRVLIRPIRPADEPAPCRVSNEAHGGGHPLPLPQLRGRSFRTSLQSPASRRSTMPAPWPSSLCARTSSELLGVARLAADPDYMSAEYAVIVRSDLKGRGLGWALMHHLIRYAESEGLRDLHGDVLAANERMLKMCRELGFDIAIDPEDLALAQGAAEIAAERCES